MAGALGAQAQTAASASLLPPEIANFPQISAYLDVRDAQGLFVGDLQPVNLRVIEDNRPLDVTGLAELNPGVELVIAIAPGRSLAIRDSQGSSRYARLSEPLGVWAATQADPKTDLLALLIENGPQIIYFDDPADIIIPLNTFPLEGQEFAPTLSELTRAIEIASDATPRPGMGRAVLFITSPQETDVSLGLQSLAAQAAQNGVRVFVWLAAMPEVFDTPAAAQLRELAAQTGGQFFAYSHDETIPSLENYFAPLRSTYALTYTSAITTSGLHTLTVEVDTADFHAASAPQTFNLTVLPPNPIFASLPTHLSLEAAVGMENENALVTLTPAEQTVEIIIEFPDGHPRELARTALLVDGTAVAVHTAPPWDVFTWDLSGYRESARHLLKVEATDSLGLSGSSLESPVQLNVTLPTRGALGVISDKSPQLALAAGLAAALLLLLGLILSGRIRPRYAGQPDKKVRSRRWLGQARKAASPKTESPAQPDAQPANLPHWINRLHWPHRHPTLKTLATLTPVSQAAAPAAPLSLVFEETTFGRDAAQVTLTLDDVTIEPLHARLWREKGLYRIADAGTIAGTWVNYTLAEGEGLPLEHGDLVHIGRVGFRFLLHDPAPRVKPVILPLGKTA